MGAVPTSVTAKYKVDIPTSLPIKERQNAGTDRVGLPFSMDWQNIGKNIEEKLAKQGFTKEQDVIAEKAARKYGVASTSLVDKANLINRYLDDFEKEGINVPVIQHNDPKQIEKDNLVYFERQIG